MESETNIASEKQKTGKRGWDAEWDTDEYQGSHIDTETQCGWQQQEVVVCLYHSTRRRQSFSTYIKVKEILTTVRIRSIHRLCTIGKCI